MAEAVITVPSPALSVLLPLLPPSPPPPLLTVRTLSVAGSIPPSAAARSNARFTSPRWRPEKILILVPGRLSTSDSMPRTCSGAGRMGQAKRGGAKCCSTCCWEGNRCSSARARLRQAKIRREGGSLVVTPPSLYHQGCCPGSLDESTSHGQLYWERDTKALFPTTAQRSLMLNGGRTFEAIPPVTSVPLEPPSDSSIEGRLSGDISDTQAPSAPKTPSVSPAKSSHLGVFSRREFE